MLRFSFRASAVNRGSEFFPRRNLAANRDRYLSDEQVIALLREAWDARVTQRFCLTEEDVQAMIARLPAEYCLEAFRSLRKRVDKLECQRRRVLTENEVLDLLDRQLQQSIQDYEQQRFLKTQQHAFLCEA